MFSEPCEFSNFLVSPDANYYIQECKGPSIGETVVRRTSDNAVVKLLNDNSKLREKVKGKKFPKSLRLNVNLTEEFTAPVVLHLPNDYKECSG